MTRLFSLSSLFILFIFLFSCDKSELSPEESALLATTCDVKDPMKQLSWLQDIRSKAEDEKTKGSYAGTVHLINYEGQSYFIYQRYVMSCLACEVYDCDGSKLDILTQPEKHMATIELMSEKTIIYRSLFN